MKKILIYLFIFAFLISCGGDVSSNGDNKNPQNNTKDENPCEDNPTADDGETPPPLPC